MKFLAFILSITIMALSVMPCRDIHASDIQRPLTVSQGQNTHQCGHDDHCSPFCLCNCCARTATSDAAVTALRLNVPSFIVAKKEYTIRNLFFPSCFYDPIWQPPKPRAVA